MGCETRKRAAGDGECGERVNAHVSLYSPPDDPVACVHPRCVLRASWSCASRPAAVAAASASAATIDVRSSDPSPRSRGGPSVERVQTAVSSTGQWRVAVGTGPLPHVSGSVSACKKHGSVVAATLRPGASRSYAMRNSRAPDGVGLYRYSTPKLLDPEAVQYMFQFHAHVQMQPYPELCYHC